MSEVKTVRQKESNKQPANLEAEQALLGSILVNNDIIDEVSNFVNANIFYDPAHVKIYEVIENLNSKGMIANPITLKNFFEKVDNFEGNKFLENLAKTKNENFYGVRQKYTSIETLGKVKKTASSVDGNSSASIYRFNDYNIVEFTTKANALDYDSMDALKKATDKPLIIINESMQFSAGVNLTYTMEFADKNDFKSIEKFIRYFQETCKHLKYSKYPVISAPSGLTLGGGFEVLVQSNFVASHTNIVIGLVETIVGLIPAGGGCKEMLGRWLNTDEAKKDPNFAPLKVFDIIGYGKTATSPVEAEPLKYLLPEN